MSEHKGFTLWMTGLSGSGKSTITEVLIDEFEERGLPLEVLDGDVVRENLERDPAILELVDQHLGDRRLARAREAGHPEGEALVV